MTSKTICSFFFKSPRFLRNVFKINSIEYMSIYAKNSPIFFSVVCPINFDWIIVFSHQPNKYVNCTESTELSYLAEIPNIPTFGHSRVQPVVSKAEFSRR